MNRLNILSAATTTQKPDEKWSFITGESRRDRQLVDSFLCVSTTEVMPERKAGAQRYTKKKPGKFSLAARKACKSVFCLASRSLRKRTPLNCRWQRNLIFTPGSSTVGKLRRVGRGGGGGGVVNC